MQQAAEAGQLLAGTDTESLGNYYATVLHGLSVQARDGVSREALYPVVRCSLLLLQSTRTPNKSRYHGWPAASLRLPSVIPLFCGDIALPGFIKMIINSDISLLAVAIKPHHFPCIITLHILINRCHIEAELTRGPLRVNRLIGVAGFFIDNTDTVDGDAIRAGLIVADKAVCRGLPQKGISTCRAEMRSSAVLFSDAVCFSATA
ncbi:hypothetical protein ERHA55_52770 (plasmid) [Erwinia rhapontici]|nr:hypothetical protein ERHA55_52770 [Erwinia rhapontici]